MVVSKTQHLRSPGDREVTFHTVTIGDVMDAFLRVLGSFLYLFVVGGFGFWRLESHTITRMAWTSGPSPAWECQV